MQTSRKLGLPVSFNNSACNKFLAWEFSVQLIQPWHIKTGLSQSYYGLSGKLWQISLFFRHYIYAVKNVGSTEEGKKIDRFRNISYLKKIAALGRKKFHPSIQNNFDQHRGRRRFWFETESERSMYHRSCNRSPASRASFIAFLSAAYVL